MPAVTLDGSVIHKSGLMTGGRSSRGNGKKWEEKEVQGLLSPPNIRDWLLTIDVPLGLHRARDKLMQELNDLGKSKPRSKDDETLIADITRLEPALQIARDDLVICLTHLESSCATFANRYPDRPHASTN